MVRIKHGTFGYQQRIKKGSKTISKIIPITSADGPQSFEPELEARLVREGVAEYVKPENVEEETFEGPYNDTMKPAELREAGKKYGLKFLPGITKVEMAKALNDAHKAKEGIEELKQLASKHNDDGAGQDADDEDDTNSDADNDTDDSGDADEDGGEDQGDEDEGEDDGSKPPDLDAELPT
jgi:hypothetical protein